MASKKRRKSSEKMLLLSEISKKIFVQIWRIKNGKKTYSLSFAVLIHELLELCTSFDLEEDFIIILENYELRVTYLASDFEVNDFVVAVAVFHF